jgi:hypothetical protein
MGKDEELENTVKFEGDKSELNYLSDMLIIEMGEIAQLENKFRDFPETLKDLTKIGEFLAYLNIRIAYKLD